MDSELSPSWIDFASTGTKMNNSTAINPNLENMMQISPISPTTQKIIVGTVDEFSGADFQTDPIEAAGEIYNYKNNAAPADQFEAPKLENFNFGDDASSNTVNANEYSMLDPSQAHGAPQPWTHAPKGPIVQSSYDLGDTGPSTMLYNDYSSYTAPMAYMYSNTHGPSFSNDFQEHSRPDESRGRRRPTTHRPAPMKLSTTSSSRRRSSAFLVSPKDSPRERQLSDEFKPRARRQSLYKKERPRKDPEHDWVRTNKTTQGKTTRTGKINDYDPVVNGGYKPTRHPIGTWTGPKTGKQFEYTESGELRERVFTAEEINDFLYSHVNNAGSKLTLWIQKTPADCARRYPTRGSDKCLFAECPFRYEHRNILVGHMRVAFDEQWEVHKDKRDPFFVAGYCHLYCLERFCDLPAIARDLKLRPDNRIFPKEPRPSVWAPSLGEGSMREIAIDFIKRCKQDDLKRKYPMYPFVATEQNPQGRVPYSECIPFGTTLTCLLTDAKTKETNSSKRATMESRGLTTSSILVHKGNLQLIMDDKLKTKRRKKSLVHKENDKRVKRFEANRAEAEEAEADAASDSPEDDIPPPPRQARKRKAAAESRKRTRDVSDDDDAMDISEDEYRPETHVNKRRKHAAPSATMHITRPTPTLPSQTAPTPTTTRLPEPVSRHGALMDSLYDFSPADYRVPEPAKKRDEAAERKDDLMGSMFGF